MQMENTGCILYSQLKLERKVSIGSWEFIDLTGMQLLWHLLILDWAIHSKNINSLFTWHLLWPPTPFLGIHKQYATQTNLNKWFLMMTNGLLFLVWVPKGWRTTRFYWLFFWWIFIFASETSARKKLWETKLEGLGICVFFRTLENE